MLILYPINNSVSILRCIILYALFFQITFPLSAANSKTDSLLQVAAQLNYNNEQTIKLLLDNSSDYIYGDTIMRDHLNTITPLLDGVDNDTLACLYHTKKTFVSQFVEFFPTDSAYYHSSMASKYCLLCGDTANLINVQHAAINHFFEKNNNEKVYKHISTIIEYSNAIHDDFSEAGGYMTLGFFYYNIKNYDEAIKAYEMSLMKVAGTEREYNNYSSHRYLAVLYYLLGDYSKSIENCEVAIAHLSSEKLNKPPYIYTLYQQKALLMLLYTLTDREDEGAEMLPSIKQSLDEFFDSNNHHYIYYYLGEYYFAKGDYDQAIYYLEASEKAYSIHAPSDIIALVLNRLGHATMKVGDLDKSSIYFDKALHMNDSLDIVRRNNILNITDWKVKYDLENKKELINDLEFVNEKSNLALKKKNYIILFAVLLVLLVYLFYVLRKKKILEEKAVLWDQNRLLVEEKEQLRKQNSALTESIESIQEAIQKEEKKYGNSNLTEAEMLKVEELILKLLVDKKYYLNPKLTLESFAKKLEVNRTYLSQIINQRFEMNFRQLINYYRVIEAHKLLCAEENDNYSIDYIAKEAGFKSLSPFIEAFKKHTGVTPAVYRKKHKKSK